jgi:ATP-dependent exoDNAse (exonuclease V) beta subunit
MARLGELLRDDRARWMLFGQHRQAGTEVPLSGSVDGELRSVVVDRMFVDDRGQRWIIDYKSGQHGGGGLEEFVTSETQRHAPQLRLYARLAAQLGNEPVRVALYFPWLGVFRELPAGIS